MNIFYNLTLRAGSNKINVFPDSSLGVDYDLVLPPTAPTDQFFLVWNAAAGSLEWSDTATLKSPSTDSNTFTVNDDLTVVDSPTENCSFVVNRGDSDDALLQWNETTDKWELGTTGDLHNISKSYNTTFSNVDIVANVLTVTHNLNGYPLVAILDNNNIAVGMSPTHTNTNTFTLNFEKVGTLTGIWKIRAIV